MTKPPRCGLPRRKITLDRSCDYLCSPDADAMKSARCDGPKSTWTHEHHAAKRAAPRTGKSMSSRCAMPRWKFSKPCPVIEGRDYVFGLRGGGLVIGRKPRTALDAKANQAKAVDAARSSPHGSHWHGKLGVAPHVAEAVLNHLPAKLIRTYDRNTYEPEKRAALETWGQSSGRRHRTGKRS